MAELQVGNDVFSVADIIGKTLFGLKPINLYDYPDDAQKPYGVIPKGQPVGVVYSWLDANPAKNRSTLWWVFEGDYYAKHHEGDYDVNALRQQGVLSEEEKIEEEKNKNKEWYEKLADKILPVIIWVSIGGIIIQTVGQGLFQRKNKINE